MVNKRFRFLDAVQPLHFKQLVAFTFIDMTITLAAYLATFAIRLLASPLNYQNSLNMIALLVVLTPPVLYGFGVYHRIWERTSGHGITVIIKASITVTLLAMALNAVVTPPRPLPFSVILVSNLLALSGFIAVRYRSRLLSGMSWRWRAIWHREFPVTATRVLIVGAGEAGQTLALRLKHRLPSNDYRVIGFIDDDPEKKNMYVEGCKVYGNRTDIPKIVEEQKIDLIVLALHNISGTNFRDILNYCEQTKALVKVIPDILALMNSRNSNVLLRDVRLEDLVGRSDISRHEAVDLSPVIKKIVLVTGAAGSIGSELSRQLVRYEPTVLLLLDNNESGLYDLMMELGGKHANTRLVPILADITNRATLDDIFAMHRPQVIFHAAAYKHVPLLESYPAEALRVNIAGTRHLAELACEHEVERFVLVSTDKAINPTSVMGASKRLCELVLHTLSERYPASTLFTSVRFGNVLGSRGSVVPLFSRQIEGGGPVTVTHPEMTRYFMSIPEAANLIIHAACLTEGGDTFVLRMGEVVRIVDLAERMIRLRGLRPGIDIQIKFTGIRPGEKLHEELYESCEKTLETAHPHIVKVTNGDKHVEPSTFFMQLDQFMAQLPGDAKTAVRAMLDLIPKAHLDSADESFEFVSTRAS